uniref:UDP-GlcNAc:betaGal beta-1,3-N-acetylglucosaminyltransferase-like 1 n=1 Tax=Fundulus heteroclitus TaxID=8078 RepID=A0A3Q2QLK5_FUNHE
MYKLLGGCTVGSTVPCSKKVLGSNPTLGLSAWSLHVLPVHAWLLSGYSSFLPQSKNMTVRLVGLSKLSLVSVILPVHNASCWLEECLQAILDQDFTGSMELSAFDDASTDDSRKVLEGWRERMEERGISVVISGHNASQPGGVGFAKNKAVTQSSGQYLCFQDADDIMLPQRIRLQYETALLHPNSVSFNFLYSLLIHFLLFLQFRSAYTSHGPTVVMPTWFCSRKLFLKVGSFDEGGKGVPEDLLFFYQLLRQGGCPLRVDRCLLVYRYHERAATHSVTESVALLPSKSFPLTHMLGPSVGPPPTRSCPLASLIAISLRICRFPIKQFGHCQKPFALFVCFCCFSLPVSLSAVTPSLLSLLSVSVRSHSH